MLNGKVCIIDIIKFRRIYGYGKADKACAGKGAAVHMKIIKKEPDVR